MATHDASNPAGGTEQLVNVKHEHQINFWYIIAALLAVMLIQELRFPANPIKTIPYSEFEQLVSQGKITDVVVGTTTITGTYKTPEPAAKPEPGQAAPPPAQQFQTYRVPADLAPASPRTRSPSPARPRPGCSSPHSAGSFPRPPSCCSGCSSCGPWRAAGWAA